MPNATRSSQTRGPRKKAADDRYAALEAEIAEMRRELEALRQQLASEVRTRRLVVVDESGFERIVGETGDDWGQVSVYGRPDPRRTSISRCSRSCFTRPRRVTRWATLASTSTAGSVVLTTSMEVAPA